MLGLILKDIFMLKNNIKIILLFTVMYIFMMKGDISQLAFILSFVSIMFTMSSFSYDTYNKFDTFACALPNGRKNMVASKYTSCLIILLGSGLITYLIGFSISFIKTVNFKELSELVLISMLLVLIIESLIIPFIFKFGIEKGRYILFIGTFLISGLMAYIMSSKIKVLSTISNIINNYWIIILPLIALIILIISYLISRKIYSNNEY